MKFGEKIKKITDVFMLKEDDLTSKKRIKLHLMKVGIEHYNFILNNVYCDLKFNRIIKQKKLFSRKFTIISSICMVLGLVINIVLFSVVLLVAWLPLIIWIFFMHYYPFRLFDSVFDLDFEIMKVNSKFTPVKIFKNKVFQDSLCNKILLENEECISVLSYCLLDGYAFERIRKKLL